MIIFPEFNPVALSLGPLDIHWYGIMYLVGFLSAWGLAQWRIAHFNLAWNTEELNDLIFYAALGVVLGGRIGYMLFYNMATLWHSPWVLFKVWEGGMSFHGGLIGVFIAIAVFAKQTQRSFWSVTDFVAPLVPLALAAGRWGNFINGELWGRVTTMPWGMVFPHVDKHPRHPSQLYELGLEGILLFIIVWWAARKPRREGIISAIFLVGYALCRMVAETWREPDKAVGFLAWGWLTEGQLLSLPVLLLGLYLGWVKSRARVS
jgi:phosphatidylglycerol:prolipoprotein diacylglycerol transferase